MLDGAGMALDESRSITSITSETVAAVRTTYKKQKNEFVKQNQKVRQKCDFCGRVHAKGCNNCPAGNSECFTCGKTGHFANCCRNKGEKSYHTSGTGASDATVIGTIAVDRNVSCGQRSEVKCRSVRPMPRLSDSAY